MAGVINKSQISISLSSFLLIFTKTHLLTEELGAYLPVRFVAVSIGPTMEVVNNPMEEVVRNFPLFEQIQAKIKSYHLLKFP